jgi:flagellar biosynthesis chaperone FliJ
VFNKLSVGLHVGVCWCCVQVAQGKADAKQLAQEKQRLGQMQQKLEVLEDEKTKTASRANSLLSFLGLGGSSKATAEPATSAASSPSSSGKQGLVSKSRGSLPQQRPPQQQGQGEKQGSGSKNVLVQTWEALGQQLLQLEGRLSEQESKTQKQRLSVQQLKEKVSAVC